MNQDSKKSFASGIMAGIMCLVAGAVGSAIGASIEINRTTEKAQKEVIYFVPDHMRIAQVKCEQNVYGYHAYDKIYHCMDGTRVFMDDEMMRVREIQAGGSKDPVTDYIKHLEIKKAERDKKSKSNNEREYARQLIVHNVKVIEIEKVCENHQGFHHHKMTPNFALCRDGYYVAHDKYPLEEDMVQSNLRIDMDIVKQIKVPAVYE